MLHILVTSTSPALVAFVGEVLIAHPNFPEKHPNHFRQRVLCLVVACIGRGTQDLQNTDLLWCYCFRWYLYMFTLYTIFIIHPY